MRKSGENCYNCRWGTVVQNKEMDTGMVFDDVKCTFGGRKIDIFEPFDAWCTSFEGVKIEEK